MLIRQGKNKFFAEERTSLKFPIIDKFIMWLILKLCHLGFLRGPWLVMLLNSQRNGI